MEKKMSLQDEGNGKSKTVLQKAHPTKRALTLGILWLFRAFSSPRVFPTPKQSPRPHESIPLAPLGDDGAT
jgi:hypothetical protein